MHEPEDNEFGVFRKGDTKSDTPMENKYFKTAKIPKHWIKMSFMHPENFEVRGRHTSDWKAVK